MMISRFAYVCLHSRVLPFGINLVFFLDMIHWLYRNIGTRQVAHVTWQWLTDRRAILRLFLIHHSLQLIRALSKQHDGDRCEENLEVKEERLILYVVEIKEDHLSEPKMTAAANLPEARDARLDGVPTLQGQPEFCAAGVFLEIVDGEWARTDEAHLPSKRTSDWMDGSPAREEFLDGQSDILHDLSKKQR